MAYMRRTQRISLGLASDYLNSPECELFAEESKTNGADLGTKRLDHTEHWDHMTRLQIR